MEYFSNEIRKHRMGFTQYIIPCKYSIFKISFTTFIVNLVLGCVLVYNSYVKYT